MEIGDVSFAQNYASRSRSASTDLVFPMRQDIHLSVWGFRWVRLLRAGNYTLTCKGAVVVW